MAFNFDVEQAVQEAQKRGSTPANPANSANPVRSAKRISSFSNFSNDDPSKAELEELTKLIHDLARLEGWSEQELAAKLWERDHMALCNVRKALAALRIAYNAGVAIWPDVPSKVSQITLCELVALPKEFAVIQGGKSKPQDQAKRTEPEAA